MVVSTLTGGVAVSSDPLTLSYKGTRSLFSACTSGLAIFHNIHLSTTPSHSAIFKDVNPSIEVGRLNAA